METRPLGRADGVHPTGLELTVVGLGGSPLASPKTTEKLAMEAVWAALEAGINWIDTAPAYGSEAVIGKALRARPDLAAGCFLSTKTGSYRSRRDYSYDGTLRSVEHSMELLGVEHLDVVHIHDVRDVEELHAVLGERMAYGALCRLRDEGVVGHIGLGVRGVDRQLTAIESGAFEVILYHNDYNLLDQSGRVVVERSAERGMGLMLAGVYATGILAKGSASPDARYHYGQAGDEVRRRAATLERLCAKWDCSLPAAAIQFCLRGPAAHAVALLGARNADQVRKTVRYAQESIPSGFWQDLEKELAANTSDG